jgi:hypothetical protein
MEKQIRFEVQDPKSAPNPVSRHIPQVVGSFGKPISLRWPTDSRVITQGFGTNPVLYIDRNLPGHEGLDIRAPASSKVYACADGIVETVHAQADDGNPYGLYLTLAHSDGYRTLYAHLSAFNVHKGQSVQAGNLIGTAGTTGETTGGHIHLSLMQLGATERGLTHFPGDIIDPTPFLQFHEGSVKTSIFPWAIGRCLTGLRFSDQQHEVEQLDQYAPEAFLFEMHVDPNLIREVKKKDTSTFLMTELELPATRRSITSSEWAAWVRPRIERNIQDGVGYFAGPAAPNLVTGGLGLHWTSGREFGTWWALAVDELKSIFPSAKFGFPALSPGGQITGQRVDADAFMEGADDVIVTSDWLSASCDWDSPKHMSGEDEGGYYAKLRRYFPDQLIFITEFGSTAWLQEQSSKLNEAKQYVEQLQKELGIGAAFLRI